MAVITSFDKQFDSFSEIYNKELAPRKFDVYSVNDSFIIARYFGNSELRKKDGNLESGIFKIEDKFIFRTDTRFYANRVKFNLSEPLIRVTGYNDNHPIQCTVKVMSIKSLDDGIENFSDRDNIDSRILFLNNKCMDVMTHVGLNLAKSRIR